MPAMFYVKLDKEYIEEELNCDDKNRSGKPKHLLKYFPSQFENKGMYYRTNNSFPVLTVRGEELLIPDEYHVLRYFNKVWFLFERL